METFFERISAYWSYTSYMLPVIILVATLSILKIQQQKEKSEFKFLFQMYLASLLVLVLGCNILYAINLFSERAVDLTIELANNIFNLVEAYVFLRILLKITEFGNRKNQIKILFILNIALTVIGCGVLFNSYTRIDNFRWAAVSSLIHFYSLIIPCIWYFYDIYKYNSPIRTTQISLVLSIASYSLLSIPVFAMIEYSYVYPYSDALYLIHFILLCVVCLTFCFSRDSKIGTAPKNQTHLFRNKTARW